MATIPEEAEENLDIASSRPHIGQRKSSFSDAINKLTTSSFNRRRTTTLLPHSSSSTHFYQQSRLPTPSGIPRSTSFFSSLNTFSQRSGYHTSANNENRVSQPPTKSSRKISDRLAQAPFFTSQQHGQQRNPTTPIMRGQKRDSSVKIETRGLMQPMHPPLPRSSTMGNLLSTEVTPSQSTVSLPQPKSSIANKKASVLTRPKPADVLTSPARIVKVTKIHGTYPTRVDSLPAPPARAAATRGCSCNEAGAIEDFMDLASSDDDTILHTRNPQVARSKEQMSIIEPGKSKAGLRRVQCSRSQDIEVDEQELAAGDEDVSMQGVDDLSQHAIDDHDVSDPRFIHSAQLPSYWLGRYTALSDLLRSEALPESTISNPPFSTRSVLTSTSSLNVSDHNHPMHDPARRDKCVFARLRGLCTTAEAQESLAVFERLMEEREEDGRNRMRVVDGGADGRSKRARKSSGNTVKDKKGWLEGLMGKRRTSTAKV